MQAASRLLLDDDGNLKPFNRFLNDVKTIDKTYNGSYLQAEYNFAVASAQSAAAWQDFAADGDAFYLRYRTAGDERVRESHRLLDGITLPPSAKFWDEFFPPNDWNCRCSVIQVSKSRTTPSSSEEAIARGRSATYRPNSKGENKAQIFRFNPGKQRVIFPPKHPYLPKNCGNCKFKKFSTNEDITICEVCLKIRHMQVGEVKKFFRESFKDKSLTVESNHFQTGKFILTNTGVKNYVEHATVKELPVIFEVMQYPKLLEFAREEEIDREHHTEKNAKNKENRNISGYIKYYITVGEQDYTLSFERHKAGFEQPYAIRTGRYSPKKRR